MAFHVHVWSSHIDSTMIYAALRSPNIPYISNRIWSRWSVARTRVHKGACNASRLRMFPVRFDVFIAKSLSYGSRCLMPSCLTDTPFSKKFCDLQSTSVWISLVQSISWQGITAYHHTPFHLIFNLIHHMINHTFRSRHKQGNNTLNKHYRSISERNKWLEQNHRICSTIFMRIVYVSKKLNLLILAIYTIIR